MSAREPRDAGDVSRARPLGRAAAATTLVLGVSWAWPSWASEVASSTAAASHVDTATTARAEVVAASTSLADTATAAPLPAHADEVVVATSSEARPHYRGAVAVGVRPMWGLAGAIAEQGHGLDLTLGVLFETPHGVAGYVGSLGLPLGEYGVARGEVWSGDLRASVGLVYLQRLITLGAGEGPRLELQAGGQAEFMYVDGHWRVPSPCLAATVACEGSTYSADTRRLGARILGGVGATGWWGRWRLALAGWLGPELASGALDFEGLVTPATRARFEALTADGRVSGVALVAALHASLGVTFEAPGGER
jgi:hypothetical protein